MKCRAHWHGSTSASFRKANKSRSILTAQSAGIRPAPKGLLKILLHYVEVFSIYVAILFFRHGKAAQEGQKTRLQSTITEKPGVIVPIIRVKIRISIDFDKHRKIFVEIFINFLKTPFFTGMEPDSRLISGAEKDVFVRKHEYA